MQLAVVAAGFTPGEADQLRRAMAAWRRKGGLEQFERRLVEGMRERGYTRRLRPADLPADPGLRRIRLSRIPRGQLRAAGLRVRLAQVLRAGRVRLRAAEQPADGLLRPCAARAGRAPPRRGGAAGGCDGRATGIARWNRVRNQESGIRNQEAGAGRLHFTPCASACAWSTASRSKARRGSLAARAQKPVRERGRSGPARWSGQARSQVPGRGQCAGRACRAPPSGLLGRGRHRTGHATDRRPHRGHPAATDRADRRPGPGGRLRQPGPHPGPPSARPTKTASPAPTAGQCRAIARSAARKDHPCRRPW